MYLFELFDNETKMVDHLRGEVMDYLTPLAAQKVKKINMREIKGFLKSIKPGIVIDRSLITQLIDPEICQMINKIEGDDVYFSFPVDEISMKTAEDEEKQKEKVGQKASKQAKKAIDQKEDVLSKGSGKLGDGK